MKTTRREFITTTGIGAGALAFGIEGLAGGAQPEAARVLPITATMVRPDKLFRPLLILFLNAELNHSRLREQIEKIGQAGFGGMMTVPFIPLPNKVMDDAWLDAVEVMFEKARQEQLEVWIWDDWVFPSGMGGGLVTDDHLSYRAKRLYLAIDLLLAPGESLDCAAPERMVAAAACPTDKHGAPAGEWRSLAVKAGKRLSHQAAARRERCAVVCWDYFSAKSSGTDTRPTHVEDSRLQHPGKRALWRSKKRLLGPESRPPDAKVRTVRPRPVVSPPMKSTSKGTQEEQCRTPEVPWDSY